MRRDSPGVAGYLEVFILIAVVIAGSGVVLGAGVSYLRSLSGPSVTLLGASIREGGTASVESVTVSNDGTVPLGGFVLTTSDPPAGSTYCVYLRDPGNGSTLEATCPAQTPYAGVVTVSEGVPSGSALQVEVLVEGAPFAVGTVHLISVTAADGALASARVQVAPA